MIQTPPDEREHLGRLVHETRVAAFREQIPEDPDPRLVAPWEELTDFDREVAMRIGAAAAAAVRDPMWEQAYMDVQAVLDRALGTREEDGAGAGIAADVALLARMRDEARAQLARAAEAHKALSRVAESKTRELYAAWIEVRHGSNNDIADEILAEACEGFGGPQWNGTETGIEWLERTRVKPCGCDSSRRCLDCATDDEVLAAIPDFPGTGEADHA